jgi:hypothetical protein
MLHPLCLLSLTVPNWVYQDTLVHRYLYQSDIYTLRAGDNYSPQGSIMTSLRVSISNAVRRSRKELEFVYRHREREKLRIARRHEELEVPKAIVQDCWPLNSCSEFLSEI